MWPPMRRPRAPASEATATDRERTCDVAAYLCRMRGRHCRGAANYDPPSDRVARGPPHWIGPIADYGEAAALRTWLELGQWETTPMPRDLGRHQLWTRKAVQSN